MNDRRGLLKTVLTIIFLLAVGFSAGFYAYVPIQKWTAAGKGARERAALRKMLDKKFLGRPAPDLSSSTAEGRPFRLQDQAGKVVLLFFWASTCPYSRNAIPDIKAIHDRYGNRKDFEIVGVSVDKDRESLLSFSVRNDLPWTNLFEEGKGWDNTFARAFQIRAIPSHWIIDRDLSIRGVSLEHAQVAGLLSILLEGKRLPAAREAVKKETAGAQDASTCTEN